MAKNSKFSLGEDEEHFNKFAKLLKDLIAKSGAPPKDLVEHQKNQIDTLVELEAKFSRELAYQPDVDGIWDLFVIHVCDDRRNILSARPFFRERQDVFTEKISDILKSRKSKQLRAFRLNYQFVVFVLNSGTWNKNSRLVKIANQINKLRTRIAEENLPLAISRARIFWSKTPKSQLSYMDLVQICAEGLLAAIDKFVPPFSRVFRSVIIGRSVGNCISEYNQTLVHFFPSDKRKIYRANKALIKVLDRTNTDWQQLANTVNLGGDPQTQTTASEISGLIQAASCVSMDHPVSTGDDIGEMVTKYAAEEASRPDLQVENVQAFAAVVQAANSCLNWDEVKVLKLKGVSLDGF